MMRSRTLYKSTNSSDEGQMQLSADDPAKNIVLARGMNVREVNLDTQISPSAPTLIEITRLTYRMLVTHDYNIQKLILPEYLDYYATALLWCRITSLKHFNYEVLTVEEEELFGLIKNTQFSIPEPILIQLRLFGKIQTMTREHLRPSFPSLPTGVVKGRGGFYGPIDKDTHNLYEELPCMGVLSEAVQHTVSEWPPGPYPSSLAAYEIVRIPNSNLLGYKPLNNRISKAKNLAFHVGITADDFPETIPTTGFNINFMCKVSEILARTKTFKISTLDITTMTDEGSISQVTMQRCALPMQIEKAGELFSYGNFEDQDSAFGLGIVYCPNLYKAATTVADASQWCCIDVVPQSWIDNRNERRETIPNRYREEVFVSQTQSSNQYRQMFLRALLTER
ncbi:PREDICTED: uncharacterized protein LOC105567156 [Vollenhovia emeryi]|uniref:uncharacterized protein LOC105567156 n=1 Tax=Vollenhovia emeryi TaxID=411798 RepID=UPI0005F48CDE|nr:PREDICTED: uncharacterized protein LOC105567156 [Vollenhovia emeryi]XP_011877165.1 PREDICTED: uncharacterized protein LOC105567156 [Vollenhovia emeryi]